MSLDPLGILGQDVGPCASNAVAAAIRPGDPGAAEMLDAQALFLREGSALALAQATALGRRTEPHQPGYRSEISFYDLFDDNLTLLHTNERAYLWLHDDDIITLEDCKGWDPAIHPSAWELNTDAADELANLVDSPAFDRVSSIRLLLFEGVERTARVLRGAAALSRVSHLELRQQKRSPPDPVASIFPALRGLCCGAEWLDTLAKLELPTLRSLVIRGSLSPAILFDITTRMPALRHLGLHFGDWNQNGLATLLAHPLVRRLTSLELYDVSRARGFPFDAFLASRDAWQHLLFVALPGHVVDPAVRARFLGMPVSFVSHDRREVMALDFETHGWAELTR